MKRICSLLLTVALLLGLFTIAAIPAQAADIVAKGIDVSQWQGNYINWNAVKNSGHGDFAILRGFCWGKDSAFDINYANAKAAGVPLGVYVYIYGTNASTVQWEINSLLEILQGKQFEYPIYVDIEDYATYGGVGRQATTDLVKMACQMLEDAGYFAGVYTYTSFAASYIYMDQLTAYTTWIADYRGYVGYTGAYAMWQYGCEGNYGGINPVDVNYSYVDFPPIVKSLGLNGYEPSVTYPYEVDNNTTMLYDGESKAFITTAFAANASVNSGNKTEGSNSLKLDCPNPRSVAGNAVGGMAVLKFPSSANLSGYNYIQYDLYLSRKMVGSHGFQVNFVSDTTEDGYNAMQAINEWEAGWHTITLEKSKIGKAVNSADWSNINKMRFCWFNFQGDSESAYFLIDNIRMFKQDPSAPSEPEYSEPEYSEPEPSKPEYSEPESSEPEPSEPEEVILYGDVDLDGEVSAKDALEVLKYSVGMLIFDQQQLESAEVMGDFTVDAKDALEILKYTVGNIAKFPVEE